MGRNAFWWPSIFSIVCACIFTNISWMNFLEWIMYEGFKFKKDFTPLCPCPVSPLIHKCQVINIKRLWSLTRVTKTKLSFCFSFFAQLWNPKMEVWHQMQHFFFVMNISFPVQLFFLQFYLLQICLVCISNRFTKLIFLSCSDLLSMHLCHHYICPTLWIGEILILNNKDNI